MGKDYKVTAGVNKKKKKNKLFKALGSLGGKATFKKYGSSHYKRMSKKGIAALKKSKLINKIKTEL